MNIKITQEEHEYLYANSYIEVVVGSHMYESNDCKSDLDILLIYDFKEMFGKQSWKIKSLPNIHQFQYTDSINNVDYLYCTLEQFWKNQRSGDSTINSDIIMFSDEIISDKQEKINHCRTLKVIKAYLGFAERDIKQYYRGVHKLRHAARGIYVAKMLMAGFLPLHSEMKSPVKIIQDNYNPDYWLPHLKKECADARTNLMRMYENNEIPMYYIPRVGDPLLQKLLDSNNIKEFKYE